MPKAKKPKPVSVKRDPAREAAFRKFWINFTAAIVFSGFLFGSFWYSRKFVAKQVAFPNAPPRVELKNRPAWMSDVLAEEIKRMARPAGTHSAFDHQLLVDIDRILCSSPWIRQVRAVRREFENEPGDTIEIDCDYRAPVALVRWKDYFWLVDGEGVKLPAQFKLEQLPGIIHGADKRMNIRIIEGVAQPPVESGHKWPGDDLQAGLDLVKLLFGQQYTEEIIKVDVANFGGRINVKEAQLALGTLYDTQIRWGRPVKANDFFVEVATQRKLDALKHVYEQYNRVDAGQQWIDIRFDKITYPSMVAGTGAQ
jgi:hypothetical protein